MTTVFEFDNSSTEKLSEQIFSLDLSKINIYYSNEYEFINQIDKVFSIFSLRNKKYYESAYNFIIHILKNVNK